MPIQLCPMYQITKEVISSHLIPAALYKEMSSSGRLSRYLRRRASYEGSRQMQAPLLCLDCEDILNKGAKLDSTAVRKIGPLFRLSCLADVCSAGCGH